MRKSSLGEEATRSAASFHLDNDYIKEPVRYGSVLVYQIGRMFCLPGAVIQEHAQGKFYELTCVTGGRGTVHANGEPREVSSGDVFVSFPFDTHRIESDSSDPLRFDFFTFYPTGAEELELSALTASRRERVIRNERIPSLVSAAVGESVNRDELSSKITECQVLQIVLLLVRELRSLPPASSDFSARERLALNVMSFLDENVAADCGSAAIAERFHFNPDYVNRAFRALTGMTVRRYAYLKRMQAACALMSEGKLTMTEISDKLGYASPAEFCKAFKTAYGCSPTRHPSYAGVARGKTNPEKR